MAEVTFGTVGAAERNDAQAGAPALSGWRGRRRQGEGGEEREGERGQLQQAHTGKGLSFSIQTTALFAGAILFKHCGVTAVAVARHHRARTEPETLQAQVPPCERG